MTVKYLMIWLGTCLVAGGSSAQILGGVITARSASGQFTARALNQIPSVSRVPSVFRPPMNGDLAFAIQSSPASTANEMKLVPALLTVSCDRIKNAFLIDLGMADEWRGRIDLFINASRPENDGTLLAAVWGRDGWNYELELPQQIKPQMLMRSVVEALLLETANRNAGNQCAEIPLWLIEGISAHLLAYNLPTFFVQAQMQMAANKVKLAGLDAVREQLRRNAPLTFQQLSWPSPENLAAENYELYSGCSQLFLDKLLLFPDGPGSLRKMLQQLPDHLNWQTAFLRSFSPHFSELRDVEKWWGLGCADFCGYNFAQRQTFQESSRKIQEALDVPVEVHFSADSLPTPAEVTLEEIISEWRLAQVLPVLDRCAQNLELLRYQIAPEFVPLVDAYLTALRDYMHYSQTAGPSVVLKKAACKQLRLLDERRESLRQKIASAK